MKLLLVLILFLECTLCQITPLSNGEVFTGEITALSTRQFSIILPDSFFTVRTEIAASGGNPENLGGFSPRVDLLHFFETGDRTIIRAIDFSVEQNSIHGHTCPNSLQAGTHIFVVENPSQQNRTFQVRLSWRDSRLDDSLMYEGDTCCRNNGFSSADFFTYQVPNDIESLTIRVSKSVLFPPEESNPRMYIRYDDCPFQNPETNVTVQDYFLQLVENSQVQVTIDSQSSPPLRHGQRLFIALLRGLNVGGSFSDRYQIMMCPDGECSDGPLGSTSGSSNEESSGSSLNTNFSVAFICFSFLFLVQ